MNSSRTLLIAGALALVPAIGSAQAPVANPAPAAVQAGTYAVETSHTRVQFSVSHMGFSDWYGDFTGVTGTLKLNPKALAKSSVAVTIPVASVS
ncbi:MAG TPA: YceI family protein, partial [Novosphingobium sp.]|nr:YceI family protein [Novosphingobium sp.]